MATKSTKTSKQTEKRAFTLKPEFSLWKKQDQNGKPYFSGKTEAGKYLVGFYNTKKKNPKEPDLRVYFQGDKGEELNTSVGYSIWHNVNEKTGKQYFSGVYTEGETSYKVVGFISKLENEKAPYINFYLKEEQEEYEQPALEDDEDELELPF